MTDFEITYASDNSADITGTVVTRHLKKDEYFLALVKNGIGKFLLDNCIYKIAAGCVIFCKGEDTIKYRFHGKDGTDLSIICFTASSMDFTLPCGVYRHCGKKFVLRGFSEIINEFILKKSNYQICIRSLLSSLMCKISRIEEDDVFVKKIIYELALDIHKNYLNGAVDVAPYAQKASLSKDRLSVIFKNHFGYAPYKYHLMLKMAEATKMLKTTNLSIGVIAEKLGFSSPLYFSSAYKKQTGHSPGEIKKCEYNRAPKG